MPSDAGVATFKADTGVVVTTESKAATRTIVPIVGQKRK